MKYELKRLPKSEVKLMIEVTVEELQRHKEKAAEDISKEVKISGFRPGRAPLHILEQYVDKKEILAHAYEIAVQMSYAEAVVKEKLQVVSRPKIKFISDTTKDGEPLKFEAEVAVLPEVKLKGHKDIKIPKEEVKVTEKEVTEVIEDLKKHYTEWKDIDRPVKKGDRVEVDFEGFEPSAPKAATPAKDAVPAKAAIPDDLKPIPSTASKNHPIIIGENTMVPGFEEEIVGMKKDEKKEFTLTFPKDYHKKDFQNKKVLFKLELKRIEEGIAPELNETLIEKITGQKMSVEEFNKDVKRNIEAQKTQKAEQDRENKYIEELLKKVEVEVPEALIDEELDFIIKDMEDDLLRRGLPFDKFLEHTKMTLEKLREKYKKEAEKRIKTRLAITHIIDEEKINVTDEEVEKEVAKIVELYPEEQRKKIRDGIYTDKENFKIKNRLLIKKFFDLAFA